MMMTIMLKEYGKRYIESNDGDDDHGDDHDHAELTHCNEVEPSQVLDPP